MGDPTPFIAAVMITISVLVYRLLAKLLDRRNVSSGALASIEARLARIEQAVDSTAIEVERISEAQRFTTKLLAERGRPALGDKAIQS